MEKYDLDDRYGRFVPEATKCKYCRNGQVSDPVYNYFLKMYHVNKRTNLVVYRSVRFNKVTVGVPRCKSCFDIHESAKSKGLGISVSILTILAVMIYFILGPVVVLILLVVAPFVMVFGPEFLGNIIAAQEGILPKIKGAKSVQFVQAMMLNGWALNVRP